MNTTKAKKYLKEENCCYCGKEFDNSKWGHKTVDHKKAIKKGGQDLLENYILCCRRCNVLKGTKTAEVFIELLKKWN